MSCAHSYNHLACAPTPSGIRSPMIAGRVSTAVLLLALGLALVGQAEGESRLRAPASTSTSDDSCINVCDCAFPFRPIDSYASQLVVRRALTRCVFITYSRGGHRWLRFAAPLLALRCVLSDVVSSLLPTLLRSHAASCKRATTTASASTARPASATKVSRASCAIHAAAPAIAPDTGCAMTACACALPTTAARTAPSW